MITIDSDSPENGRTTGEPRRPLSANGKAGTPKLVVHQYECEPQAAWQVLVSERTAPSAYRDRFGPPEPPYYAGVSAAGRRLLFYVVGHVQQVPRSTKLELFVVLKSGVDSLLVYDMHSRLEARLNSRLQVVFDYGHDWFCHQLLRAENGREARAALRRHAKDVLRYRELMKSRFAVHQVQPRVVCWTP